MTFAPNFVFFSVIALTAAGCDTTASNARAAYVEQNGTLVEVPYHLAEAAAGTPHILDAIARDPNAADVDARLKGRDLTQLSQAEIADLSLIAAREICNIPEGVPITATTPCNF